jgi:hypothetical protein
MASEKTTKKSNKKTIGIDVLFKYLVENSMKLPADVIASRTLNGMTITKAVADKVKTMVAAVHPKAPDAFGGMNFPSKGKQRLTKDSLKTGRIVTSKEAGSVVVPVGAWWGKTRKVEGSNRSVYEDAKYKIAYEADRIVITKA